jgi:hypothetical protein
VGRIGLSLSAGSPCRRVRVIAGGARGDHGYHRRNRYNSRDQQHAAGFYLCLPGARGLAGRQSTVSCKGAGKGHRLPLATRILTFTKVVRSLARLVRQFSRAALAPS